MSNSHWIHFSSKHLETNVFNATNFLLGIILNLQSTPEKCQNKNFIDHVIVPLSLNTAQIF